MEQIFSKIELLMSIVPHLESRPDRVAAFEVILTCDQWPSMEMSMYQCNYQCNLITLST